MSNTQKAAKNERPIKPWIIAIIATILLIVFVVIALLFEPTSAVPVFEITDRKGSWEAQGKIAVFDETIKPGSEGAYKFILKSDSEATLVYGIFLQEYLDNIHHEAKSFMKYRLKLENVYIGNDNTWYSLDEIDYHNIEILPGSEQQMTLEWQWPFEGDDVNDTLLGRTGGELSIVFFLWAQVVEDDAF